MSTDMSLVKPRTTFCGALRGRQPPYQYPPTTAIQSP